MGELMLICWRHHASLILVVGIRVIVVIPVAIHGGTRSRRSSGMDADRLACEVDLALHLLVLSLANTAAIASHSRYRGQWVGREGRGDVLWG